MGIVYKIFKANTKFILLIAITFTVSFDDGFGQGNFSSTPESVAIHTEDIQRFWTVFDKTSPDFDPAVLQREYIDVGSKGLMGFIKFRIKDGEHLSYTLRNNLTYYKGIRQYSLLVDKKKETFYECFNKLKEIYPKAVFPDVYFVIGAKNSGGTVFKGGLIIGAEMFGKTTEDIQPPIDIDYVDDVLTHELIHFQQKYAKDESLLAQCIKEGSADFICELITGEHSNKSIYEYGNANSAELWQEFLHEKDKTDWSNWLYQYQGDGPRPKDLGYWIGYKISKAYYDRIEDKKSAIIDILNIRDFSSFLQKSGYKGEQTRR